MSPDNLGKIGCGVEGQGKKINAGATKTQKRFLGSKKKGNREIDEGKRKGRTKDIGGLL